MRSIKFEVRDALPPKKDGANSMWGKNETEAKRLIALRKAAVEALDSTPFTGFVRLTLGIHAGKQADEVKNAGRRGWGDLDNFVCGVCDGLMAADPRANIHDLFANEDERVRPNNAIAYQDDSNIMEICARKAVERGESCWYEVTLEELSS